jgi:hypothetical protein
MPNTQTPGLYGTIIGKHVIKGSLWSALLRAGSPEGISLARISIISIPFISRFCQGRRMWKVIFIVIIQPNMLQI